MPAGETTAAWDYRGKLTPFNRPCNGYGGGFCHGCHGFFLSSTWVGERRHPDNPFRFLLRCFGCWRSLRSCDRGKAFHPSGESHSAEPGTGPASLSEEVPRQATGAGLPISSRVTNRQSRRLSHGGANQGSFSPVATLSPATVCRGPEISPATGWAAGPALALTCRPPTQPLHRPVTVGPCRPVEAA